MPKNEKGISAAERLTTLRKLFAVDDGVTVDRLFVAMTAQVKRDRDSMLRAAAAVARGERELSFAYVEMLDAAIVKGRRKP